MRRSLLSLGAVLGCLSLFATPAAAQTATDTFAVSITINAECLINSAADLNFGATGILDTTINATSDITVECTNTTPYNIGLNAGTATGATVTTRQMTGPNAATVDYALYTESGHTDNWGDTVGTDTVSSTGNGSEQIHTVYGQVLAHATTPEPGSYTDTITVTVTY